MSGDALANRLWARTTKGDGCWIWSGPKRGAYGSMYVRPNSKGTGGYADGTHRVSYELANGPIPKGMYVCHKCDTPLCVRPDHLFLGTVQTNTADAVSKGRMARGSRHFKARYSDESVAKMKLALLSGKRQSEVAREFGASRNAVYQIANGIRWRHVRPEVTY